MSMEIIKRKPNETTKETINRIKEDPPQIAYNSEARITVRIPQYGGDALIVFDRPLSKELIRFIKGGITELPDNPAFCKGCAEAFNDGIPF